MATQQARRSDADVLFSDAQGVVQPAVDAPRLIMAGAVVVADAVAADERADEGDAVAGLDDDEPADDTQEEDAMPATPAKQRRSDADVLFGDTTSQHLNLSDNFSKLGDRFGLTVDQQNAERQEFAGLVNDLGLGHAEAEQLHGLHTRHRLEGGSDAWRQQVEKWPEQSRRALREQLGAATAERLRSNMDTFIKEKPALGKLLANGLDQHPRVTELLSGVVRRRMGSF